MDFDKRASRCCLKNNIALYRRKFAITQQQLADFCGVSKNTISSIENYSFFPSAYLAAKICFCFGVTFEDVFWLEV